MYEQHAIICLRRKSTSFSHEAAGALKLDEFWVDLLLGFIEDSNKTLCFGSIFLSEQRVCSATVTGTARTTNAMDVVFRTVWVVKVDHEFHIIDI